jgi:hypothetical protein
LIQWRIRHAALTPREFQTVGIEPGEIVLGLNQAAALRAVVQNLRNRVLGATCGVETGKPGFHSGNPILASL